MSNQIEVQLDPVSKTNDPIDWNNSSVVAQWVMRIARSVSYSTAADNVARRRGGSAEILDRRDDRAQVAALHIWKNIEKIKLADSPETLARTIAKRKLVDYYHEQTEVVPQWERDPSSTHVARMEPWRFREGRQEDNYTGESEDIDLCKELDEIENEKYKQHLWTEKKLSKVYAAFDCLSPDQLLVLGLRIGLDLKYGIRLPDGAMTNEEVAAHLGRSVASTSATYNRARKKLKAAVAE